MRTRLILFLLIAALAGCSGLRESRLNPFNWFGRGQSEPVQNYGAGAPDPALTDPRPLIARVGEVVLERAAGGAILRATGIASVQGYHGAELVPLGGETPINGALVYFFRVTAPTVPGAVGSERTRTVTVARFIPDSLLSRARSVVVRGDANQQRASR